MTNDRADLLAAAERAVQAWPIDPVQIELASLSENAVFRVDTSDGQSYALRIHRPGYNTLPELESELAWTDALRAAGIDLPTAIRTKTGTGYVPVTMPGWTVPRQVGLVEWLPGKTLATAMEEQQATATAQQQDPAGAEASFAQLGRIAARMHNQASAWTSPSGFARRAWDADGLVGPNPLWGRFWELPQLSAAQHDLLLDTRQALWNTLREYGTDPQTYGLIHADLHPYNVLVDQDRLTVIDFDDAGFGWHQYELAVALPSRPGQQGSLAGLQDSLIKGYRAERALSDQALSLLPAFMLVRTLVTLGWVHARPELGHGARIAPLIEVACAKADAFLAGTLL
jgi:Ser/Thr protein kinase RdoA (MazF antagonist)